MENLWKGISIVAMWAAVAVIAIFSIEAAVFISIMAVLGTVAVAVV
jgi:hypothetical protein